MKKDLFSRIVPGVLVLFASFLFADAALAQAGVDDVAENITNSAALLPGLVTAFFYLLGLWLGYQAILRTIDHVSNPSQTPLRVPVVRFLAGGALFAAPIVFEAMHETIDGGLFGGVNPATLFNSMSALFGAFAGGVLGSNVNGILSNIAAETELLPGLVTAVAYLLGLLMGGIGIMKIKDHVEDPARTTMKEGVINLLVGGGMFALPAVFEAMYNTIGGGGLGVWEFLAGAISSTSFIFSSESLSPECLGALFGIGATVGDIICNAWLTSSAVPAFLSGLSYFLGLCFGVWALVKIKNHVINPQQTSLWDGVSRLLAGGAFFALPTIIAALQLTFAPVTAIPLQATRFISNTTFRDDATLVCGGAGGLDDALACFMDDILGPGHVTLNFFSFVAGMIFIMIGVSRIVKTAQEGARGPGGRGTIATFVVGGILLSATTILRAFSASFFGNNITFTFANLAYTAGMTPLETQAVYHVIGAVLKFMILIGMISFVRGLFIMRDVAEGNQQASLMAAMTHIIGGALAVNLGPLLNAVQTTLGVTAFGVTFV
ncbi:MAG: hypothetical protein KDI90_06500 [Alphaproteobacteria bacterium]|nr:hypothetical protein [Alphaproteobacteria bacterium]MCB9975055.1 hypothetical protein [Rhodospirillales bacterium]